MPTLADLFFRAVDVVFAVDSTSRIVFWNPACEQLMGIPSKDALERPCADVFKACTPTGQPLCKTDCGVAHLARGGSAPETFSLRVRDAWGKNLSLSVSIILVPSRRKDLWTVVHLLHRGEAADSLESLGRSFASRRSPSRRKTNGRTLPSAVTSCLTAREHEILHLLAEGLSVPALSQRLCISPVTVRNHIQHLLPKLGVHSQMEAVAYAYRHNLL